MTTTPACPPYLVTLITYACNYACPGCYHGHREEMRPYFEAKRKNMRLAEFRGIVDEVAPHRIKIGLNSLGEVFLNPDVYDMIAYAVGSGLRIEFDTNGSLLEPDALAEAAPSDVIFSVDGMSQESYASYRVNGRLDVVLGKLERFARNVDARGTATNIYVKFLINGHNEHEVDEARRFVESLPGVRFLVDCFFPPPPSFGYRLAHPDQVPLDIYEDWRPRKLAEYDLFAPHPELGVARSKTWDHPFAMRCTDIYNTLYVDTDGGAYPCCFANTPRAHDLTRVQDELLLGNVFRDGVLGVFHGERAARLREAYTRKQGRIPVCGTCRANRVKRLIQAVEGAKSHHFETLNDFGRKPEQAGPKPAEDAR
ncbi:radical SAM protein [Paucidesulfovibrio longus]|uniref:radical SAM protein n=1 Tax=Paucidesulfovibrio longus TaxID=889 RepID=UPI0003B7055D|nr:radical SAM protein [Paucidesulfovibrio longus]